MDYYAYIEVCEPMTRSQQPAHCIYSHISAMSLQQLSNHI